MHKLAADVAGENADECSFECLVEGRVDDRIHNRRRVAEPQEGLEQSLVDVAELADAHDEVDDEERRPAGDERHEHHPDHSDRFALGPHHRPGSVRRYGGVVGSSDGSTWYRRLGQHTGQAEHGTMLWRQRRLERCDGLSVGARRRRCYRHVAVRVRRHLTVIYTHRQ